MLRRIMVRAHQIAKGFEGDYQARLSLALRQAWKEERGNKMSSKEVKSVEDLKELLESKIGTSIVNIRVKRWEGYGKSRTYINLGVSAHNNRMTYYIDNDTNKLYSSDNNVTARWTIEVNKNIISVISERKEEIKKIAK